MERRIRLADVSEAALADAESICAVDPNVPGYYKQVWTLTTAADAAPGGEAVSAQNVLEVELDSGDPDQFPKLKGMVETAKAPFLEGMWDLKD
jgi:hypothetical protein